MSSYLWYEIAMYYVAIATSFLAGISYCIPVAIISSKNLYKFDKGTSLIPFVIAMIFTEITMIIAIHVTFGSIV